MNNIEISDSNIEISDSNIVNTDDSMVWNIEDELVGSALYGYTPSWKHKRGGAGSRSRTCETVCTGT